LWEDKVMNKEQNNSMASTIITLQIFVGIPIIIFMIINYLTYTPGDRANWFVRGNDGWVYVSEWHDEGGLFKVKRHNKGNIAHKISDHNFDNGIYYNEVLYLTEKGSNEMYVYDANTFESLELTNYKGSFTFGNENWVYFQSFGESKDYVGIFRVDFQKKIVEHIYTSRAIASRQTDNGIKFLDDETEKMYEYNFESQKIYEIDK